MQNDSLNSSKPAADALKRMRVLLAEDSPDNQLLISHFLKASGATIDFASDGEEAVQMVQENSYDIILMDVQMPKLDGYEATQKIREMGFTGPILALTAHAMQEEIKRSKDAGCNCHLIKPINADSLVNAIIKYTTRKNEDLNGHNHTQSAI